ncbi:MAG: triosephosphate isomerase [Candidatus Woesearchaeota archaeon]|nr:triosephosphate isomerase [Candidatus Woesearchaeota archaeon]
MNEKTKGYLFINLKTYLEGSGEKALELCKTCDSIKRKFKLCEIVIISQVADIYRLSSKCKTKVFSQHVDITKPGAYTGKVLFQTVKDAGAKGILINHSEDQRTIHEISELINACKKNDLTSLVCTINEETAQAIAQLNPDFIAIEPPELIGTKTSVSTAKPHLIEKTVKYIKSINPNIKVLCGAGIHSKKDVTRALELGSDGVLVASALVKPKNRSKKILEMCEAIEQFFEKKKKY